MESQNLAYIRNDGSKVKFNKDTNLNSEIDNFLSDGKIDKTELQALHYILYKNKGKEKEIAKLTSSDKLSNLSEELSNIKGSIKYKYYVRNKINNILNLSGKTTGLEKGNKIQNYRSLKNESRKLGKKTIQVFQKIIGTRDDGSFGPNTFRKYKTYNKNWKNESITDFLATKNGKRDTKEEKSFFEKLFAGNKSGNNRINNEKNRNKNDKEFTNRINKHNEVMDTIGSPKPKDILNFANQLKNLGKAGLRTWKNYFKKIDYKKNHGGKDSGLHCTGWVDYVYMKTTGKSVYDSKTLFNGVKSTKISNKSTGLTKGASASTKMLKNIKSGDHVILYSGPGRTHSVIATGPVSRGKLPTISYPNGGKIPKNEKYKVAGRVIRIQRA